MSRCKKRKRMLAGIFSVFFLFLAALSIKAANYHLSQTSKEEEESNEQLSPAALNSNKENPAKNETAKSKSLEIQATQTTEKQEQEEPAADLGSWILGKGEEVLPSKSFESYQKAYEYGITGKGHFQIRISFEDESLIFTVIWDEGEAKK